MSDKPTYLSEALAGRATRRQIDDWVVAWNDSNTTVELNEYLGLTPEEYATWVQSSGSIDAILASHGWKSPDVTDTGLFRVLHDKSAEEQQGSFQNASLTTVGDMAISISITAPEGLDYRNTKVVNDLFRATFRRLVDVGCVVEIQIGPDDAAAGEEEGDAIDRILGLRGEARG